MVNGKRIKELAVEGGFELAGVARAGRLEDAARYRAWVEAGMAGEMGYMTESGRAAMREEVRRLADWVRFARLACAAPIVRVAGRAQRVPPPLPARLRVCDRERATTRVPASETRRILELCRYRACAFAIANAHAVPYVEIRATPRPVAQGRPKSGGRTETTASERGT